MKLDEGYICLNNVRIQARHGVMPQERAVGGSFVVSLRARCLLSAAMESDDVADTVNYAELLEIVKTEMQKPSCLLENAAGRIGRSIFGRFPQISTLRITLAKVNPPMSADMDSASVELHLINDKTI